jgi:P4 family phage/plasmid primase-like protien
MEQITTLLKHNRVDGIFHSHVSMINPKGKFQFNSTAMEEFWPTYCSLAQDEKAVVGIAEKPMQYIPVLVDVDLKVIDNGDDKFAERLYTEDQVKQVVSIYQSVLRKIVNDCSDDDLKCVVLEKKLYQQTKNEQVFLKHGFHLHFPVFIDKESQEIHLIPRVKKLLEESKLFCELGYENSGDVIDKACCRVPWLLYGSRKSPEHQPYRVTKVYDSNLKVLSLEKAFRNYQIFNNREEIIDISGQVEKFLPRILSIFPQHRKTKELVRGLISPIKEEIKKKRNSSVLVQRKMSMEEALDMSRKLLPMLADFRAEDRNEWMNVGWILYNVTDGHPDGLDLWLEFSQRCEDKYDESVCISHWDKMVRKDLGMGTLRHMASIDNPEEYKRFKQEQAKKHIDASLEGSHNDIAKALYEEYGDEFVCASVCNKIWFQFCGHTWEQIEDGVFLREKISGKIIGRYTEAIKAMYDELGSCDDKGKQAMLNARIKAVGKMIQNLKNANFKNAVMKEAMEVFYDHRFRAKLDMDPYLIAFKNGVYDLKLNIFRAGRPEDFLSKSLPINYRVFTELDEKVQAVHTFLEQVFPDKSLRNYFMDNSSDIFVGGNHEKIVIFWLGDGDNGKSVTQAFFEQMLGNLAIKLNTGVITGKKPSPGAAFADLARAGGGVRWAVLEEPDGDEAINVGIFKSLSGNDSFFGRDLFEKGKDTKEIKPLFKLIFIANKLPRIKHADKAVWNRVRVIPFESTFCRPDDPAPESYEEQIRQKRFPMDKQFSKKIPDLIEAFAWILLEHRKKITKRIEPDKVRQATELYKKNNDIYRQFIDESIYPDPNKKMSLTELYAIFKEWFKESMPGHSVPVKNEVEEYFVKNWGPPEDGKKWSGYRRRTIQDSIDDGSVILMGEEDLVVYDENGNIVQKDPVPM